MSTSLGCITGRQGATNASQGEGLRDSVFLTRFFGGDDGICLQMTIGDKYAQLDAQGIADLRDKLDRGGF